MSLESFNPSSPKYKDVKDLPQEEQENFADVPGGFVMKSAFDNEKEVRANVVGQNEYHEFMGEPEKMTDAMTFMHSEALRDDKVFDRVRARGSLGMPPNFPPSAEFVSDKQFQKDYADGRGTEWYRTSISEYNHYPAIGSSGLRTRYGLITGPLVWCDGITAIFDTPQGKIKVSFGDLILPSGKTFDEVEKEKSEKEQQRYAQQGQQVRYKSL